MRSGGEPTQRFRIQVGTGKERRIERSRRPPLTHHTGKERSVNATFTYPLADCRDARSRRVAFTGLSCSLATRPYLTPASGQLLAFLFPLHASPAASALRGSCNCRRQIGRRPGLAWCATGIWRSVSQLVQVLSHSNNPTPVVEQPRSKSYRSYAGRSFPSSCLPNLTFTRQNPSGIMTWTLFRPERERGPWTNTRAPRLVTVPSRTSHPPSRQGQSSHAKSRNEYAEFL